MSQHESLWIDGTPQSSEEKILALIERVTRQEAKNDLLCTAIAALAASHPDKDALVEEWRHLSSAVLTDIHLQVQRNPLMLWKSQEAGEFFSLLNAVMTGEAGSGA